MPAELGWTGLILLVPLLLGFVSLCRLFRKEASSDDWVGSLTAIQVASLLLWWFFISDLAWFRHIIPCCALALLLPLSAHGHAGVLRFRPCGRSLPSGGQARSSPDASFAFGGLVAPTP